jgi:preprotein translocase subunit SecG
VEALRVIVTVLYVLVCVALVAVVIMQEGKQGGLGALSGSTETYWSKNKGRSIEGKLELITKVLAVLFVVISIVLNMNW